MRETRYLPPRAAANLARAVPFAATLGRPLNCLVSVNLGLTACPHDRMDRAFGRIRKNFFPKWLRRHAKGDTPPGPPTFVWVNEGKPGHYGFHWLLHIPPGRRQSFERELARWVDAVAGPCQDPATIDVRTATTPRRVADYLLKGLHPRDAQRHGVKAEWQGIVPGKRCGMSLCLGPAARRRAAQARNAAAQAA